MAPFRAKEVERGSEREKIKIIVSFRSYPAWNRKCKKKKSKKTKKIKKYHYGFISRQNSLERPRKREIKNFRFVQFLPDALQKIPKKRQKIQKLKKIPLWLHFKPKSV